MVYLCTDADQLEDGSGIVIDESKVEEVRVYKVECRSHPSRNPDDLKCLRYAASLRANGGQSHMVFVHDMFPDINGDGGIFTYGVYNRILASQLEAEFAANVGRLIAAKAGTSFLLNAEMCFACFQNARRTVLEPYFAKKVGK